MTSPSELSSPSPRPPPDYSSISSETKRILSKHLSHFLGLSVLFLIPISFFSSIYFTLQTLLRRHSPTTTVLIILPLMYSLIVFFLSFLAVGSISFSTYHISFGRPVKLRSTILSLLRSFVHLLFTSLASLLIQILICSIFWVLQYLTVGFEFIVFGIDQSSPISFYSSLIVDILLVSVLIYLQMNWAFASIIVVIESSWGFESLRRSANLVKGTRKTVLSLIMFCGIMSGCWIFPFSFLSEAFDGDFKSSGSLAVVVFTLVSTCAVMLMMLQYIISITVLYKYCKDRHDGEIAGDIANKFSGEYVSLIIDDGKDTTI